MFILLTSSAECGAAAYSFVCRCATEEEVHKELNRILALCPEQARGWTIVNVYNLPQTACFDVRTVGGVQTVTLRASGPLLMEEKLEEKKLEEKKPEGSGENYGQ